MDRLLLMEAFVRVVDAGSFSSAARKWGRSKAVVSKYVAALESHLGVELLRRTTRSLSLTSAGAAYHDRCLDLLGELDAMEASLRESHLSPRGPLRVTAPPGFVSNFLRVITTDFVARYPEVTLDLDLSHRMIDLVSEGIDVAIRVTEPRDSSLVARKLAPAPVVAIASPAYLAKRGTPRRPSDLRRHDCVVDTNYRDQQRWRFEVRGKTQTVVVQGRFRVNNPLAVRELVADGHGIGLCTRFVAEEALASGRVVEVLAGKVGFSWNVYALYPRRRYLSGRVRAFVDHVAEAMQHQALTM